MDNVDDDDDDLDDDCGGHVDHPSRTTKARTLALGGGNHSFMDEGHVINAQNIKYQDTCACSPLHNLQGSR